MVPLQLLIPLRLPPSSPPSLQSLSSIRGQKYLKSSLCQIRSGKEAIATHVLASFAASYMLVSLPSQIYIMLRMLRINVAPHGITKKNITTAVKENDGES